MQQEPGGRAQFLRTVGLPYETVVDRADLMPSVNDRLDRVGTSAISVAVGRVEWTAFPWEGHEDAWSEPVRRTGRDYVGEALRRAGSTPDDVRRETILVVDCLVPRLIEEDPSLAGEDATGERSTLLASMWALESGPVGDLVVELVGEVAERYRPDAVSLTELFAEAYTFGDRDLESFLTFSGATDWPRTGDGDVAETDPAIAAWRSAVIAGLVGRAADAAAEAGSELLMEVRANVADPEAGRPDSGQDYELLLEVADRLVLWDYPGLTDRDAVTLTRDLADAANSIAPGRFVMSVGLWADDGVLSPEDLAGAAAESPAAGVDAVWVTPESLMEAGHWEALERAWLGEIG